MFDHLFIAEKPSLAESVARARAAQLGVKERKANGYFEVGPDAVTWLFGHMYEQANPELYDKKYESWDIGLLPIIPQKWKLVPSESKKSRIKEIQGYLKNTKKIVNLGDAGREGQLLVDELIVEAGMDPFSANVYRLWLQDMTQPKIIESLKTMFPNSDKKHLYFAAVGRQQADWLLGMNMTRLYTALGRRAGMKGVVSVGRVQSPTLGIVVARDREIANFKPVDHFIPSGLFRHANGVFKAQWIVNPDSPGLDSENRLIDRSVADQIAAKIMGKTGKIENFSVSKKEKAPPLPFDLGELQKELSAKLGYTAQQTLEVAQKLYETYKVTSYPRTGSQYLPTGILSGEAQQIVNNLSGVNGFSDIARGCDTKLRSPAWNDSKITDHYAIIPTVEANSSKLSSLSPDERKVFDIIAKRFLAQFYPNNKWDSLSATVLVEGERFKATGREVTQVGWKAVYEKSGEAVDKDDDEKEDEQSLPKMQKGDAVVSEQIEVNAKRTSPPSRFTDGTLIEAMKSIHKFVSDPEIKKKLREKSGLGTDATRSSIIELLLKRNFLKRDKKYIVSTPVGKDIIDIIDKKLTDPGLTAAWEDLLNDVEVGNASLNSFISGLGAEVHRLVDLLKNSQVKVSAASISIKPLPGHGEKCPSCNEGILLTRQGTKGATKGKTWLSCSAYDKNNDKSCKYARWPETEAQKVEPLPGDGTTCSSCGEGVMVTRMVRAGDNKGQRFLICSKVVRDDPSSCRNFIFPKPDIPPLPQHGQPCPKCRVGKLITRVVNKDGPNKGKRFLVCDKGDMNDKTSCQYFEWPQVVVDQLPGHGDTCPKCRTGKMVTRISTKDGPNKGKRFLSCDAYNKDNPDSCRHVIYPPEDRNVRGKPAPKFDKSRSPGKFSKL